MMKKQLIRLISLALCSTFLLSAAACASTPAPSTSGTTVAEEPGETTKAPAQTKPVDEYDPAVASLKNADIALESYISTFSRKQAKRLDWIRAPYNRSKSFWTDAEVFEVLVDYVGVYKDEKHIKYMDDAFASFQDNYQGYKNWTWNEFNDDLMWMTIATAKAYLYTGNETYKDCATTVFDYTFRRAWTKEYGGGMLWKMGVTSKNACVNYPATIAACLLYQIHGDSKTLTMVDYPAGETTAKKATYLDVAKSIYRWTNEHLRVCDSAKGDYGRVYDTWDNGRVTNEWSGTYNLGTCIGGATLLYELTKDASYLEDAKATFRYTAQKKYGYRGVVNDEANGNDLPGFKGIMVRWMCYLIKNHYDEIVPDMKKEFDWLKRNVTTAWKNRNSSNIIWTAWATKTSDEMKDIKVAGDDGANCYSNWGCSAALSLLVNYPYDLIPVK